MLPFLLFLLLAREAFSIGCIKQLCGDRHQFRNCEKNGVSNPQCGHYKSERWDGSIRKSIDLMCGHDEKVYAPFDATVSPFTPYNDGTKWDYGLKFTGEGQWSTYTMTIGHFKPLKTSGKVKRGEVVGHGFSFMENQGGAAKEQLEAEKSSAFVQVTLKKQSSGHVDPTSHIFNCSCTGQICQTNRDNALVGNYKSDPNYGVGFEVMCKDRINIKADDPDQDTSPIIYAPMDGTRVGRIRSRDPAKTGNPAGQYDCDDEGIFITNDAQDAGNIWREYEVRIYNVRTTVETNTKVSAGDPIGRRIQCGGKQIKSVFMEMRYRGKLFNFREQLQGTNCTMNR